MIFKIGDHVNRKGLPDLEIELTEGDCAKAFGLSLRRLRAMKKISLDKLAEEIGLTNPSMNRYESGYNLPSIYNAYKIAYYFDTTIETMISCGLFEMEDLDKGRDTSNNKYIENLVGMVTSLNKQLGTNNKLIFRDHQKPKKPQQRR